MKNFSRVLRLAFRYRVTFVASIACAIGVAVLWGGNITTLYPFVEVIFRGDSPEVWVDQKIAEANKATAEMEDQLAQLHAKLPKAAPAEVNGIHARIGLVESRLVAEQKAAQFYVRAKPYVLEYLPTSPFAMLSVIIVLLLLGTVVKDLFVIAQNILVARLVQRSTLELRRDFFARTLDMNLAAHSADDTADLMSRFTHDMENVATGLNAFFVKLIREPLKMAACLIGAAVVCWRLLLLTLVIAPVATIVIRWLGRMLKRANRRAMEEMAQMYTTLEEVLRSVKIVKAFTNEPRERERFRQRNEQYYSRSMKIAKYSALSRPIGDVVSILAVCLTFAGGAWLVLSHETHLLGIRMSERPLGPAALLVFYGMLAGMADPIRKFSGIFTQIQRASAASDRIYERLDREPDVRDPADPIEIGRHQRDVVLENVFFEYQTDTPVLHDINVEIRFGETVAVVGPNGCGKSTLLNLIPRFYDPTRGEVRLDGVSLRDLCQRDLRGQIGLVTQETLLFDDTVYNNIRYGAPDASRDEVIAAAQKAQAHDFIQDELPDGYETVVGAMGNRLSGGQRQRISLARAVLRDPAILLLDEATSQVDLESERAIQEVLEEFIRNRTALIITHRLATLALADKIIVMSSGRILDFGPHDQLLQRCELYRQLHRIQFEEPHDRAQAA